MFGAEALERKFGATPTVEWTAMCGRLTDTELARGLKRLAYSGLNHVPNLPEFVRYCTAVSDDSFDIPRETRALPDPNKAWSGDAWDEAANTHLLAYLTRRQREGFVYCDPDTAAAQRDASKPTQETRDLMAPLLGYKKSWAQDMREAAVDHATGEVLGVDPKVQREAWADCMARAEAMVDEVRKRYALMRAGNAA